VAGGCWCGVLCGDDAYDDPPEDLTVSGSPTPLPSFHATAGEAMAGIAPDVPESSLSARREDPRPVAATRRAHGSGSTTNRSKRVEELAIRCPFPIRTPVALADTRNLPDLRAESLRQGAEGLHAGVRAD
jgi:hypothetical protein